MYRIQEELFICSTLSFKMELEQHYKGSSVLGLLGQQEHLQAPSSAIALLAEGNGTPKGQNLSHLEG